MQKVKVGNTSKKICSSSPREGRRLSPLSPSPRGRKLHVCLREHPPPHPFSTPPPASPPPVGRQAGEIRRASAPPRRPALLRRSPPPPTPLCSAVLTPAGRGARAGCCAGLRGSGALAPAAAADMSGPRAGFYRQELNKTVWEVPQRLQGLRPVGSGAYGSVW